MGKTSKTLQMLRYLSTGRQFSKDELAELVGTNRRNIYEYKKELQDAGYVFKILNGKSGGYALDQKELACLPKFTSEEIAIINDLSNLIQSDKDFINASKVYDVLLKILQITSVSGKGYEYTKVKNENMTISKMSYNENYNLIMRAIKGNLQIKGKYYSYSSSAIRLLNPYDLVNCNSQWYVTCYDVENQKFKTYKLNRFEGVEITNIKYWKDPNYSLNDFFDENGMSSIGEEIRVKLRVYGPYMKALIENEIGKDVVITNYGSFIIYETTLRGEFIIQEFILKMGRYCTLISPKAIKNKLVDEWKECLENAFKEELD